MVRILTSGDDLETAPVLADGRSPHKDTVMPDDHHRNGFFGFKASLMGLVFLRKRQYDEDKGILKVDHVSKVGLR